MQASLEEMYLLKEDNNDLAYICDGDNHRIEIEED